MEEGKEKKDIQKLFGILAIIFGLILFAISIYRYFDMPTPFYILLIEIVGSILFILFGTLITLAKERNKQLRLASTLLIVSLVFFFSAGPRIPIVEGIRTLQGALASQGLLIFSAILYIIGAVKFFIGKSKEEDDFQ